VKPCTLHFNGRSKDLLPRVRELLDGDFANRRKDDQELDP